MKKTFKEYYLPEEQEFDILWKEGVIILDTNVLLNFYRYSPETTKTLMQTLQSLDKRVWIPYQVGKEFHERRLDVIKEQKQNYKELIDTLDEIEQKLANKSRYPFLSSDIYNQLTSVFTHSRQELRKTEKEFDARFYNDTLLEKITILFDGKVGQKLTDKKLQEIYKEGEVRYKSNIPPGFKDGKNKPFPQKYGDLVLWKELILYSESQKKPVIFVTDEKKEDWWEKHSGKVIRPHQHLVKEFFDKTKSNFYMYSSFNFLKYAKVRLNDEIEQKAIDEVEELANSQLKNQQLNYFKSSKILIEIQVKSTSKELYYEFIKFIENKGYELNYYNVNNNDEFFTIFIPVGHPDLIRRFRVKILPLLEDYGLELVSFSSHLSSNDSK
ncbi:MAG TPA: hypothetical protein DCS93_39995 [Microscillaceae bacterium]|nr:hypothetical protein [Microscillaceae bacterium]